MDVFIQCKVYSFPLSCEELLAHYGYKLRTYSELKRKNLELYDMCITFSEDAFRDGHNMLVVFNENRPSGRIRFSLMHELGHHILNHTQSTPVHEAEANFFASNLLAPRMAINYANCKNSRDVSNLFGLTFEASDIAFRDYKRQLQYRISHGNKMTEIDHAMYSHFYSKDIAAFVWNRKHCSKCEHIMYNTTATLCNACKQQEHLQQASDAIIMMQRQMHFKNDYEMESFSRAEHLWLYGKDL